MVGRFGKFIQNCLIKCLIKYFNLFVIKIVKIE